MRIFRAILLCLFLVDFSVSVTGGTPYTGDYGCSGALVFDGVNDYASVPHSSALNLSSELTLEVWVYPQTLTYGYIIAKGNNFGSSGNYNLAIANGVFRFSYFDGTGVNNYYALNSAPATNRWQHVAISYKFTTYEIHVYVDGVEQSGSWLGNVPDNPAPTLTSTPLFFGSETVGIAGGGYQVGDRLNFFTGGMDDVQLWKKARTANEIRGDMIGSLTGSLTNLVGRWKFDEASGTNILNSTTNTANGSLGGGVAGQMPQRLACGRDISPLLTGMVSWYQFESSLHDKLGRNDPTNSSAVGYAIGMVGNGLSLGNGGYIDIPHATNMANQRFTMEAWVRPDGPGPNNDENGSIIVEKASGLTTAYSLQWRATDNRFIFLTGNLVQSDILLSTNAYPPGSFYHVVGTYDGVSFQLFVNGELQASRSYSGSLTYNSSYPLTIGATPPDARAQNAIRTWNGVIDEVSLYSRALSISEILEIYFAGAASKCNDGNGLAGTWAVPGLVEAEHFDEGGEGVGYHDADITNNGGDTFRQTGVDVTSNILASGGRRVSWTDNGEWLRYSVNVQTTGYYKIVFRASSGNNGGAIYFQEIGGEGTAPITMGNTGGWDVYKYATSGPVRLRSGAQTLELHVEQTTGLDIDSFEVVKIADLANSGPYLGSAWPIPGRIEAENYDLGGEGVGYHDFEAANNGAVAGPNFRGGGVDTWIASAASGWMRVGWLVAGDWMNYTVTVPTNGYYQFLTRYSSGDSGGTIYFQEIGGEGTGAILIPSTGSYDTYQLSTSLPIRLRAGTQVIRLQVFNAAGMDIDYFEIATAATPPATGPYLGVVRNVPGRIEAEHFDYGGEGVGYHDFDSINSGAEFSPNFRNTGVDLTLSDFANGRFRVGWTGDGEWLRYSVNVLSNAYYRFIVRGASQIGEIKIKFQELGGEQSGQMQLPISGGWDTYLSRTSAPVRLRQGAQVLQLTIDSSSGWDIDSFDVVAEPSPGVATAYGGTPWSIPGRIEAENFDQGGEGIAYHDTTLGNDGITLGPNYRTTDVDVMVHNSASNGARLGWTDSGEWLRYSVNVQAAGYYQVIFRGSSAALSNGVFGVQEVGGQGTGGITLPLSGNFDIYRFATSGPVFLNAGAQALRLDVVSSVGYDLDYFDVVLAPPLIITNPASVTLMEGSTARFEVTAVGIALTYQWLLNGAVIPLATNSFLNVNGISRGQSGNKYSVIVGNSAGNATSAEAMLTVSIPVSPQLRGAYRPSSPTGVMVSGNYAYMADFNAGLQVIDVSNPTNPQRVGGYGTRGSALNVAVSGNYAYVADYADGFKVVDVSNPASPQQVADYQTIGPAHDVVVRGNYVYLASDIILDVIDVSNPTNPHSVGGSSTTGPALGVTVSGNYAYVAVGDSGLEVFNISNPTDPQWVGGCDTSGYAMFVAVSGNYAYVSAGTAGLQIIDVSNPANPILVGSYETGGDTQALAVSGNYVYLADFYFGLHVVNVTNPANPQLVTRYETIQHAQGVAILNNYAYVTDASFGLQVIEISNPASPQGIGSCDTDGFVNGVAMSGNYAFLSVYEIGLQVVNVSNPLDPQRIGGYDNSGDAWGVAVSGNYAYLVGSGGLDVIEVSNPQLLTRVGGYDTAGYGTGVAVQGNYVYVSDFDAGLQVIDVSNPASPQRVGGYDTSGSAWGVAVSGNYAYVADGEAGLQVIDVSNPANPQRVGGYDTSGTANGVTVSGNYAYVADDAAGLQVIDVSNPASPQRVGGYDTSGLAFGVTLLGGYAYVADDTGGLQVIDVRNTANPQRFGGYNTSSAWSVAVSGTNAYVADGNSGLLILKIAQPVTPPAITVAPTNQTVMEGSPVAFGVTATGTGPLLYQWLLNGTPVPGATNSVLNVPAVSRWQFGNRYSVTVSNAAGSISSPEAVLEMYVPITPVEVAFYNTPGSAHGVHVVGNYAYVADLTNGLEVINVSDPENPVRKGGSDTPGQAYSVFVRGNYAYVADQSAGLRIVEVTAPNDPSARGFYDTSGAAVGITVVGNYAYVADGASGLQIIDVSNPNSPVRVGGRDTPGDANAVWVSGDYAFVSDWGSGLQIMNISNPTNVTLVGTYDPLGFVGEAQVFGNVAYISAGGAGLEILDLTNLASPQRLGGAATLGYGYDIDVVGRYAFMATFDKGLEIFDVGNPTAPVRIGGLDTPGIAYEVQVVGAYAYVADGDSGLRIIQIADLPTPPTFVVPPASQIVAEGSSALFSVSVDGTGPLSYQWQRNGTNLPGMTNSSLSLNFVEIINAGDYRVRVIGPAGTNTSAIASLTVDSCVSPPTGLVALWRAENNIVEAISGLTGVASTGLVYTTGKIGTGFKTQNGFVRIANDPRLRPTNLTVSAWVKGPPSGQYQYIVVKSELPGHGSYGLSVTETNQLRFYIGAGGTYFAASASFTWDGNWHHVAGTYDGARARLYIDGVLLNELIIGQPIEYSTSQLNGDLFIGAWNDTEPSYNWPGTIDEVTIVNRALSGPELAGLYGSGVAGFCSGPLLTQQPTSPPTLRTGDALQLGVSAISHLPISYQWQLNGVSIPGQTAPTLTYSSAVATNSGVYRVILTDSDGVRLSDPVQVFVSRRFVQDPSFEEDSVPAAPGYGQISSWFFSGSGAGGLNIAGGPFADNGVIPDGQKVAFLQGAGTFEQQIENLVPGKKYWLQYRYNSRNWGPSPALSFKTWLDDTELNSFSPVTPVGVGVAYYFGQSQFTAGADTGVIYFESTPINGDTTLLLDAVSIVQRDDGQIVIQNPSFEAEGTLPAPGLITDQLSGWTTTGQVGVNIWSAGPFADNGINPDQDSVAVVRGPGSLAQVVQGLTVGKAYKLSIAANARAGNAPKLKVSFGGNLLFEEDVTAVGGFNSYQTKVAFFIAQGSSGELKLEQTVAGENTLLLDDVSIRETLPPSILTPPVGQSVVEGRNAAFSVEASGETALLYQWQKDGAAIPGATSRLLLTQPAGPGLEGDYTVVVTDSFGRSVTSAVSKLTIGPRPRGLVGAWGDGSSGKTTIPLAAQSEIVEIAAGDNFMIALKSNGAVIGWGDNAVGQITIPLAAQSGVVAIAAGMGHALALKNDGTLVGWGANGQGQTSFPSAPSGKYIAIAAAANYSVALTSAGSVVASGYNQAGQIDVPNEAQSGVVAIFAAAYHVLALKNNGAVVAWGKDWDGVGALVPVTVPPEATSDIIAVAAGDGHSLALKSNGSVVAWGPSNGSGQTVVPLAAQSGVRSISAQGNHSLALKDDGTTVAWGDNSSGQASIPLIGRNSVYAIVAGKNYSAILRNPNLVLNGSFEGGSGQPTGFLQLSPGDPNISFWSVDSDRVDWCGILSAPAVDGSLSAQLVYNFSGLSQVIPTVPGRMHEVRFSVFPFYPVATPVHLDVFLEQSSVRVSVPIGPGQVWNHFSVVVPASAETATLKIVNVDGGPVGPAIDNVTVRAIGIEACAPRPADLIGYWRADNLLLNLAGDSRGELQRGAHYAPGISGSAFEFDGIDDYVSLGNSLDDFGLGDFTIGLWMKSDLTFTTSRYLFSKTTPQGLGTNRFEIYINKEDNVGVAMQTTNANLWLITSDTVTPGAWNHVVVTRAGTLFNVYINGSLRSSGAAPAGPMVNSAPAALGDLGEGLGDYFPGLIDELIVAKRALSAGEINAIYSAGPVGLCPQAVPPAVARPVGSHSAQPGQAWTLSAPADGLGPLSYQWYRNGSLIPGATGQTFSISSVTTVDAADYYVVVSSPYGRRASEPFRLAIETPPQFILGPLPQDLSAGLANPLSLDVLITGTDPFTYQWIKDGSDIPGATGPTYEVAQPGAADGGTYRVRVSNKVASVTSDPALVRVFTPLQVTAQPQGRGVSVGERVELFVQVAGVDPFKYQWRLNGQNIQGADKFNYVIPAMRFEDAGTYTVAISDPGGAVSSDPADIILTSVSAVPPGDNFGIDPQVLAPLGADVRTTNTFATRQDLEPEHAGKAGQHSVWFEWTAPKKGRAFLSTAGSSFDTLLAVYIGNTVGNLQTVVSDDDTGPFSTSEVTFNANAGQLYRIAVDGLGDASGSVVLSLKFTEEQTIAPIITSQPVSLSVPLGAQARFQVVAQNATAYHWRSNKVDIAGATGSEYVIDAVTPETLGRYEVRVTGTGIDVLSQPAELQIGSDPNVFAFDKLFDQLYITSSSQGQETAGAPIARAGFGGAPGANGVIGDVNSHQVDTRRAAKEVGEPNHAGEAGGASTWFLIRPLQPGALEVTTAGSSFDTVLAVYCGRSNVLTFGGLTNVGSHNPPGDAPGACRVVVRTLPNLIYYCAVDGVGGATGHVVLNYRMDLPPEMQEHPVSQSVLMRGKVTLRANASHANAATDYQWYRNGVPVQNGHTNIMTIDQVTAEHEGRYTCEVSTFAGRAVSDPAQITVRAAEPIRAYAPYRSGNKLRFRILGGSALPLHLQSSKNLKDWTDVLVQAALDGYIDYEAPTTETNPGLFYRLTQ